MSDAELEGQVAAAEAYEGLHVPALFRQWAPIILEMAGVKAGHRVLDVACGTGVAAREAVDRVGPTGSVAGLDPLPGMLAVAKRHAPAVDWRQGAAEALPFGDSTFDAVVSQFGMMFFENREAAIAEILRVLEASGTMAVAVWDSLENSMPYPLEVGLLERMAGKAAADALRFPFVLGDEAVLERTFTAAGASGVSVARKVGRARFPSVRVMVEADLRGWLPVMGVVLPDALIEEILEAAETVLQEYVTAKGTVEFDAPALIVSASKAT